MIRHGLIFILLLFSLDIASVKASQPIPFQGSIEPALSQEFLSLQRAWLTSSGEEFRHCHRLIQKSKDRSSEVSAWADLLYAHLLLENDSVAKAASILKSSDLVDRLGNVKWLDAYRKFLLGMNELYAGKYLLAQDQFNKALVIENSVPVLRAMLYQAQAENLRYQGSLERSTGKWLEGLRLGEELGDSMVISECYLGRGVVRFVIGDTDEAERDIRTSFKYFKKVGAKKQIAFGYSMFALINYRRKEYTTAIENSLKGYNIRIEISDIKGQGESLNNLALAYMGLKNWNQALRYLDEAIQLKTRANDFTQMTVILNNIGHCYNKLGEPEKALEYFQLALAKGEENGQMGDVVNSYYNIARFYAGKNEFQKAYNTQVDLTKLKDSLATAQSKEDINELEVIHEIQEKENEIVLLRQKQIIVTNRWLMLAMALFALIIVGILFADNQKRKHRQKTELLVKEDELRKAELKIMSDLLEFNQNKLDIYTENLLKKTELVGQLEGRIKRTVEDVNSELADSKQLQKDFSLVRILTDEDWEEFKELFNGVHRGMLDRLLQNYVNLTLAEQRLFLLMKLQLSTKEIANILGVSPESIKKGRYRLKKKLGIEDSISVQDFVSSF